MQRDQLVHLELWGTREALVQQGKMDCPASLVNLVTEAFKVLQDSKVYAVMLVRLAV